MTIHLKIRNVGQVGSPEAEYIFGNNPPITIAVGEEVDVTIWGDSGVLVREKSTLRQPKSENPYDDITNPGIM